MARNRGAYKFEKRRKELEKKKKKQDKLERRLNKPAEPEPGMPPTELGE